MKTEGQALNTKQPLNLQTMGKKVEDLVLSLEQISRLKDLGVEIKDTVLAWYPPYRIGNDGYPVYLFEEKDSYSVSFFDGEKEAIPTPTLQEIFKLIPNHLVVEGSYYELIVNMNESNIYYIEYGSTKILKAYAFMGKKLKAAYKMLRWVAENGYLNASNSMPLNKN